MSTEIPQGEVNVNLKMFSELGFKTKSFHQQRTTCDYIKVQLKILDFKPIEHAFKQKDINKLSFKKLTKKYIDVIEHYALSDVDEYFGNVEFSAVYKIKKHKIIFLISRYPLGHLGYKAALFTS